jgi:DNA adenine methylase
MKPLLSWYGGKQKMIPNLLPLLPDSKVYVEPFCGGAALFFAKEPSPTEVLNDTNHQLINLYRVCQTPYLREELIQRLVATPYSRALYEQAKAIYKESTADSVTQAWAIVVANQQAFSNKTAMGWAVDKKNSGCNILKKWQNYRSEMTQCVEQAWALYSLVYSSYGSKPAEGWAYEKGKTEKQSPVILRNRIDHLPTTVQRLNSVYLECDDALAVIKRWDTPDTLFYCDPPYPNTDQGQYKGYTQADFGALVDTLASIQGSFLLSCYPNDAVPSDWEVFSFNTRMSAAGGKAMAEGRTDTKRVEMVWRKLNKVHSGKRQLSLFSPS